MRLPDLRFTFRTMMVYVAAVAVGARLAAAICFRSRSPWLTAAALFMAIPVILTRGRNRAFLFSGPCRWRAWRLLRSPLVRSVRCGRRRNSIGSSPRSMPTATICSSKTSPISTSTRRCHYPFGPWEEKRKQWMSFVDDDARMSQKYNRAARYPFLSVDPEPEPVANSWS